MASLPPSPLSHNMSVGCKSGLQVLSTLDQIMFGHCKLGMPTPSGITLMYRTPSMEMLTLSFVIACWLGTGSATSLRLWTYAILSICGCAG